MEIITSLKVVDFGRPQNEVNLAALAVDRIGKGRLDEIVDPTVDMKGEDWVNHSVHKVAELAFRCLAFERDMRPSMMEVAGELERIRLSKWACLDRVSDDSSSSSSSFNGKKDELGSRGLFTVKTIEDGKDNSGASIEESWLSEHSSPSSSSLLSTVTQ